MAFFEQRFNDGISRGSRGGPVWNTTKVFVPGGQRLVNRNWTMPLHRYDISHGIKSAADFEEVRAMFYNVFGAFDGFRYKDWNDYRATQANSTLTLISGTTWQLQRKYTVGARSFLRDITKPVSTVQVYRNGGAISPSIDYTTGIVTISGHTGGDTYTWAGDFDVPVAFADDAMDDIELTGMAGAEFLGVSSINLEEIRL